MNRIKKAFSSLASKIIITITVLVLFTGLAIILTYAPRVKKEIKGVNSSYMMDLSAAFGRTIETELAMDGAEILTPEMLTLFLQGTGLDGIESSYVYVVAPDGTMLYHPTAEKIGQPVENEAVKKTVAKIEAGQKVENEVIEYEYKGINKYAGVYVNEGQDFILVVTADEEELFEELNAINRKGEIGLVVAVLISITAGVVLTIFIVKPIKKITNLTSKVSTMDFSQEADQEKLNSRTDETGGMSRALSDLRGELAQVVVSIREKSSNVYEAAEALNSDAIETGTTMGQVESAVNDIAHGATSQAEETQKATENVVVMGDMVEETAEEVEHLLEFANEMQRSTDEAKGILRELKDINDKALSYIQMIADQTVTTNEAAKKISEATKLITAIAEETNLLSLNASIEAARAGEQGRGFAVVAAEIQKLAEQSNESALRIEEIIQELIADSERSVATMYDVKEIFGAQSDYVDQTDNAFAEITGNVTRSIDGINKISEKTAQLDEARGNVIDVVQSLTAIAEENAASAEETSASVTEVSAIVEDIAEKSTRLRAIAEDLENNMQIFKL